MTPFLINFIYFMQNTIYVQTISNKQLSNAPKKTSKYNIATLTYFCLPCMSRIIASKYLQSIAQLNLNRVPMNLEQSRQSRIQQSLRRKFQQNETENPLGKYKLIMTDYHKRQAFLTLGPNYIILCLLFLAVNLSTIFVIYKIGKSEDFRAFFLILTVATVLLDVAWLITALINPGISTANFEEMGDYCELCQANNDMEVVKKTGRFHCPQCDVCIDQQESHFKVIGGCVGKNNFIAFKVLILAVFIWGLSMVTIVPLVYNI